MSTSFADLKKSRTSSLEKLTKQLESQNSYSNNSNDGEYWKLEVDKAGNGSAVIRFLPEPNGEDFPYVIMYDHGFQGPGGWYIENSLSTIGQEDPCGQHNSTLWNSGVESNKELVRKQKRRTSYHTNIYVVKDPMNPQNEDKIFKFKLGKKIFEKIKDVTKPQFADETPVNPFNFWDGADFKLKQRMVDGWINYDKSEFNAPSVISNSKGVALNDEEIEELYLKQYSLKALHDPSNFKTYDQLKAKLYKALGITGDFKPETHDDEVMETQEYKAPKEKAYKQEPSKTVTDDDDDDVNEFFRKLAQEDE